MANYKSGLLNREKTISVCRQLFYKNGYRETPFGEICKQTGLHPGSISYHFKGKANIAQQIYADMTSGYQSQLKMLFPEEKDITLLILGICVHIKLMYLDAAYRRFSCQITTDCAAEILEDRYEHFSPLVYEFLQNHIPPEKQDFFLTASIGFDTSVNTYIEHHLGPEAYPLTVQYACELYVYILDKETLTHEVERAMALTEQLEVHCTNCQITISLR